MKSSITFPLLLIAAIALIASMCIYTVREDQRGLLLRLGKMARNPTTNEVIVKAPGLHFKLPLVNTARLFDYRIQTSDIQSSRIVTAEQKDVIVDYYAKWRINDLPLYFTRTGGNAGIAATLLEQKLNDSLRAEFGKRTIREVVSDDRVRITHELKQQADISAKNLGINVIDVRIKRIDLPTEVSNAVFARMRVQRERIATEHRADGQAKAEAIRATADAKVQVIVATAQSHSLTIRGQGDAQAARIYAQAYGKDPEFYAFSRSLAAYKKTFDKREDILVLRPDNQFFRYFNTLHAAKNNHQTA